MNTKYFIMIVALLAAIHYLLAGSAPLATPAPQAQVAPSPIAPVAPGATVAPIAPIGAMPAAGPVAPVAPTPIAPVAPTAPNSQVSPFGYTFTSGSYTGGTNSAYFTNGIPTAYLRNTNSVAWATNPPYGNPVEGYTNNTMRIVLPYRPGGNTSSPSIQR